MAEIKSYVDTNRKHLRDIIPVSGPLSCFFEATRICNLKCFYCMHATRGVPGGVLDRSGVPIKHMDMELYDKLVHDIMEFPEPPKKIAFSGLGEPLMHPRLGEMARKLRSAGYDNRLNIITNGILLTPECSKELVDADITCIQISVQGLSSKSYKKNCGVEIDFGKYMDNLNALYNLSRGKTEIYIKIIDSTFTEEENEERFYEMFDGICDTMCVEHLISGQRMTKDFKHTAEVDTSVNYYREKITNPRKVCQVMFYQLQPCVDGNVYPCTNAGLPLDMSIGNLYSQSLKEMWYNDKHLALLRPNLKYGFKAVSLCAGCGCYSSANTPEENIDDCAEELLSRLEGMGNG